MDDVVGQVLAAWAAVEPRAWRYGPEYSGDEQAAAWAESAGRCHDDFAAHYGAEAVARRFRVPADYAAYMEHVGGGWAWKEGLPRQLYAANGVREATANEFEMWVLDRIQGDAPRDEGLWLSIGECGDKHVTLLCCDAAHPRHGTVCDAHDGHPWLNGPDAATVTVEAPSFLRWLQDRG